MKAKWVSIKKLNADTMQAQTVARAIIRADGRTLVTGEGRIARELRRGVPKFGTFKILKLDTDGEAFLANLELAYRNVQTGKASHVLEGDDTQFDRFAA